MANPPTEILARLPWQKPLTWGLFLFGIYYLRDLFFVVFATFLMCYIVRSVVSTLIRRIAPGQERPWLDRGLTLATFAALLLCVGGILAFVGPRFLQQSQLLLMQLQDVRPQESLNRLLDRTVGVYLLRRTYGETGDKRYDAALKQYSKQGRHGEGLYHDFPSLQRDLESGFELQYERTEKQRVEDKLAGASATSPQFDQWFLRVKAPELFADRRESYLKRWSQEYGGPEKEMELNQLKQQNDFEQTRDEQIRQLILQDVKADPRTMAALEAEWAESIASKHWSEFQQSPEYQSRFKAYYENRRTADPEAISFPFNVYASLRKAYPEGKAEFVKALRAHGDQRSESPQQLQGDFERATSRELARKWWTTEPCRRLLTGARHAGRSASDRSHCRPRRIGRAELHRRTGAAGNRPAVDDLYYA